MEIFVPDTRCGTQPRTDVEGNPRPYRSSGYGSFPDADWVFFRLLHCTDVPSPCRQTKSYTVPVQTADLYSSYECDRVFGHQADADWPQWLLARGTFLNDLRGKLSIPKRTTPDPYNLNTAE